MRAVRYVIFLGFTMLSACSTARGQSIGGRLLDKQSRAPLHGVGVRLLPDTFTALRPLGQATTDSAGTFHIQAPAAGTYRLMFGLSDGSVLSEPVIVGNSDVQHEYLVDVAAEKTYFEFQVDKAAALLPDQPHPR